MKKFGFLKHFQFYFKFQGDLQERVFELRLQPGSQKASKLLRQFIGKDYMGVRAVARAARQKRRLKKTRFSYIFAIQMGGGAVSGRATARAPM